MAGHTEEIANKIRLGEELTEKERDIASKLIMIIGQDLYSASGSMFITGFTGEKESDGLPEYIFICPQYGADVQCTALYRKQPEKEK